MLSKLWKKFSLYNLNMRFFADDGGAANNSDAGGGNPDDGQGGGGAGDNNNNDGNNNNNNNNNNDSDQNQGKTVFLEVVVDGETRQLTKEEAIALSQKAAGAEKKFQEAAELRKQAQNGLRIQELYTRFSDPNHEPTDVEIKEFASFMNISAEELMKRIDGTSAGNAKDNNDSNQQAGNANFDFDAEFQKRFGKNPAEVAAGLAYTEKQHIENFKQNLRKESDNMVDKDEIFGKIIIDEDEKISNSRQEVIKEEVYDEVLRKIQDGIDKQTALTEAIQKVRSRISRFGISSKSGQHPITLGLVPGQSLPTEVTSEKPIERVDASDDNAETNFVNRYLQKGISALRSKVKK